MCHGSLRQNAALSPVLCVCFFLVEKKEEEENEEKKKGREEGEREGQKVSQNVHRHLFSIFFFGVRCVGSCHCSAA